MVNNQLPMVNGWQSGAAACGWRIGDWQAGCGAARTPATAADEDRTRAAKKPLFLERLSARECTPPSYISAEMLYFLLFSSAANR